MPIMNPPSNFDSLFAPLDPAAGLRAVEDLADGLAATLHMAHALVDTRRGVELAGLDRMVGLLCARALDLPPEQGRIIRVRLITLRAELDALAAAVPRP
jgi:hypothetical protein